MFGTFIPSNNLFESFFVVVDIFKFVVFSTLRATFWFCQRVMVRSWMWLWELKSCIDVTRDQVCLKCEKYRDLWLGCRWLMYYSCTPYWNVSRWLSGVLRDEICPREVSNLVRDHRWSKKLSVWNENHRSSFQNDLWSIVGFFFDSLASTTPPNLFDGIPNNDTWLGIVLCQNHHQTPKMSTNSFLSDFAFVDLW